LGRRTQLSPSVVTVEAEGGTAQGGRLEARSRRCTPVRWPHRTEPLLASWLRRACCAALVTGFFFQRRGLGLESGEGSLTAGAPRWGYGQNSQSLNISEFGYSAHQTSGFRSLAHVAWRWGYRTRAKQSVTRHMRIWLFYPPNQRLRKPSAWGSVLGLSDTSETVSHSTDENLAILPTKPAASEAWCLGLSVGVIRHE
jgi:hypothetical protein